MPWSSSDIRKVEKPNFTENEERLANEILNLVAETGMTYIEAGDFLFGLIRETEYRFSKAILEKN